MNLLVTSAVALIVGGLICTIISLLRYSEFLDRLYIVNAPSVEKWTFDLNAGENWSSKNLDVAKLFWRREYISIADGRLSNIGAAVRNTQITAILLVVLGLLLLAAKGAFE